MPAEAVNRDAPGRGNRLRLSSRISAPITYEIHGRALWPYCPPKHTSRQNSGVGKDRLVDCGREEAKRRGSGWRCLSSDTRQRPTGGAAGEEARRSKPRKRQRDLRSELSTPAQNCIAFRSKDVSMMPTRMPSGMGLSRGRQVGVGRSLGVSALLRRERCLL